MSYCPPPNSAALAERWERERQRRVQRLKRRQPILSMHGVLHFVTDRAGRVHITRAESTKAAIRNAVNWIGCEHSDIDPVTGVEVVSG
jgi:hypothetical protein